MKKIIFLMLLSLFYLAGCSDKQELKDENITVTPKITKGVQNKDIQNEEVQREDESTDSAVTIEEPKKEMTSADTLSPTIALEPDSSDTYSREYLMELSIDTELGKIKQMINDGTITGYVRGETKFLVWKYAPMGINSTKDYKFAVVDYKGDFETDFYSYDEYIENPQNIKHIGGDIFRIVYDEDFRKYLCHNTEKRRCFWYDGKYDIIEGFSEGYALAGYGFYVDKDERNSYSYEYIALISDEGEVIETQLRYYYFSGRIKDNYYGYSYYDRYGEGGLSCYTNIGKYSNGYFFLGNIFYDINLNPILNLGEMELVNQPYFTGKYCRIEYVDSGAVWGAYMDINGNFFEAPRKLYDYNR